VRRVRDRSIEEEEGNGKKRKKKRKKTREEKGDCCQLNSTQPILCQQY